MLNLKQYGLEELGPELFNFYYFDQYVRYHSVIILGNLTIIISIQQNARNPSYDQEKEFKWWEVTDLVDVKLSHNSISHVAPNAFENVPLQVLLLDDNALSDFPDAISALHETLKRLVLSHNSIETLDIR